MGTRLDKTIDIMKYTYSILTSHKIVLLEGK
jgi:hypothetical protein